jgi:exodeoxyribonuclease-3
MKIVSWNVNGIRAVLKKGAIQAYLTNHEPDILCLQETKAHVTDIPDDIKTPTGYHTAWFSAEKKGYSSVGILTKQRPIHVQEGFGHPEFDKEGRVISAEYEDFIVFSVYFPNGQRGDDRLDYKLRFYDAFFAYCDDLKKHTGKALIISGDYNTAHKEIDLARPKENANTSGFMPIEREWLDRIIERGYVDTFRLFNTNKDEYSWWNMRTRARDRNVGWRIDYFFVTQDFVPKVKNGFIQQDVMGSDHCPVGIEI